jgi:outer membrane protein OmpA-like peptidoglycan-associated protein
MAGHVTDNHNVYRRARSAHRGLGSNRPRAAPPNLTPPRPSTVKPSPDPHFPPQRRFALALALAATLAACATPPSAPRGSPSPGEAVPGAPVLPGPPAGPGSARPPAPAPTPLVAEQRWLEEWFRGTPVAIALADANTLTVDVPLANSFDAGSSSIKPALAAVLDRVATSLRRQPTVRLSIAAPTDGAGGAPALASARAQQMRDHMTSRGVVAARLAGVGTARAGAPVQLRLLTVPQAIGRLDDATLPIPANGVKPVLAPASAAKR